MVEQSFGTLHRKFRYARAAYFGLLKVSAQSHLKAMCLNLLKAANRLRPLQNSFPSRQPKPKHRFSAVFAPNTS
ncbi:putative transposase for IS1106A3 [Neisseria meningitidis]|nr:putative transposase for IS1106A3 [Neisseria meningitidis]CWR01016.1 putative transposase for IS1106A3 [Neisseria meningitidis]